MANTTTAPHEQVLHSVSLLRTAINAELDRFLQARLRESGGNSGGMIGQTGNSTPGNRPTRTSTSAKRSAAGRKGGLAAAAKKAQTAHA